MLWHDHERIREEAERDRWCSHQHVACEPDPTGPTTRPVLSQVEVDEHANRDRGYRGEAHDDRDAHDPVGDAATGYSARALRVDEKFQVGHGRQALGDREPQHQAERDEREHGQRVHDRQREVAAEPPPQVVSHAAARAFAEWTRRRATTLTVSVTRMRTRPISTSAPW